MFEVLVFTKLLRIDACIFFTLGWYGKYEDKRLFLNEHLHLKLWMLQQNTAVSRGGPGHGHDVTATVQQSEPQEIEDAKLT